MSDMIKLAPTPEIVRYLAIFRRWLLAARGYVQKRDDAGLFLVCWIADAIHNVPGTLWRYDPNGQWNSPAELAQWMVDFPQIARTLSPPGHIAAACDHIFSPSDTAAELRLAEDLSDIDLAPPRQLAAHLDLLYHACLHVRWRPGHLSPWQEAGEELWRDRAEWSYAEMGTTAELFGELPVDLVHWSAFDAAAFSGRIRALWPEWPEGYGAPRIEKWQRSMGNR